MRYPPPWPPLFGGGCGAQPRVRGAPPLLGVVGGRGFATIGLLVRLHEIVWPCHEAPPPLAAALWGAVRRATALGARCSPGEWLGGGGCATIGWQVRLF